MVGVVYPVGGGESTGNPVIPAILSILSPLRLKGKVFVACASTLKVGAFGLLRDKFISSGLKVLLRKPFSYSNRVTDMLKFKKVVAKTCKVIWPRLKSFQPLDRLRADTLPVTNVAI